MQLRCAFFKSLKVRSCTGLLARGLWLILRRRGLVFVSRYLRDSIFGDGDDFNDEYIP